MTDITAGQETEVFFSPTRTRFASVTQSGERMVMPGEYTVIIGNGLVELYGKIILHGAPVKLPKFSGLL
jgi:hypothetical protein